MTGAERCRLDLLSARLTANAYDTPALFERLVLLCATRQLEAARTLFKQVLPLLGPSRGTALLDNLVRGDVKVHYEAPCYWLGDAPVVDDIVHAAADFAREVGDTLHVDPPVLLLSLHPNSRTPTHSVRLVNGFGMIVTAGASIGTSQRKALLAHEVTHCALACGQLLLDEGLATYFQRQHDASLEQHVDTHGLPSLRALFQPEAELLLTRAGDPHYVQRAYDYGALLMQWILRARSANALTTFMRDAVLSLSRSTLAQDFERQLEVSLEELEQILRGTNHEQRGTA